MEGPNEHEEDNVSRDLEVVPPFDGGAGNEEEGFPRDGSLRAAVEAAVDAMPWLTDVDRGAVTLARAYAAQIDRILVDPVIREERPELITKALYLGPHLLNALKELGGTPVGRGAALATGRKASPVEEALKGFQDRVKTGEQERTAKAGKP